MADIKNHRHLNLFGDKVCHICGEDLPQWPYDKTKAKTIAKEEHLQNRASSNGEAVDG